MAASPLRMRIEELEKDTPKAKKAGSKVEVCYGGTGRRWETRSHGGRDRRISKEMQVSASTGEQGGGYWNRTPTTIEVRRKNRCGRSGSEKETLQVALRLVAPRASDEGAGRVKRMVLR